MESSGTERSRKRPLPQNSKAALLWNVRRAQSVEDAQGESADGPDVPRSLVLRALDSLTLGPRREAAAPVPSAGNDASAKRKPSRQLVSCRQTQRSNIPCDWTLKSQLEIQTDANVGWLLRPSLPAAQLLPAQAQEQRRLHASWQEAVRQWAYPDTALPKQVAAEQGRVLTEFYNSSSNGGFATNLHTSEPDSTADTIVLRRIRWLEAVHALTVAVLEKEVPYFFLHMNDWSAVVISADKQSQEPAIFVVGNISHFRKRLDALWSPKQGDLSAEPRGLDELETVDDTQPPFVTAQSTPVHAAELELPGIVKEGELGVRATIDVIAEFVMSKQAAAIRRDVPQLLSPVHFLHACLKPAKISSAKVVSSAGMNLHGTIKPRFRIEFSDTVLPTNLVQILNCVAEAADVSAKATMLTGAADRPPAIRQQVQPQQRRGMGATGGLNPFQVLARQDAATFTPSLLQPATATGSEQPSASTATENAEESIKLEARCTTMLSAQQLPLLMQKWTSFGSAVEQSDEEAGMFLTDVTCRAQASNGLAGGATTSFELLFAPPTGSM